ncbi:MULTISPECIES: FAD-dependent oxidoreductase [unclassified Pseudomonas]|uniref:FAD-dependent oxidoreductase n=1 Tax=unclassified Pseudomonas TaxID=196821 RepID=UPI0025E732C7|nr:MULTISPECIES: FAD-dependent oxidoreductase [unclassified Pseudomonas]
MSDPNAIETDVVVIGSGGAGLTAAVVAATQGLRVLLLEKTEYFGGTTALSGGGIWVPCNRLAAEAGLEDDPQLALQYAEAVVGPTVRKDLLRAFIDAAPRMVDYLHAHTQVQFAVQRGFADWHPQLQGASSEGRLLCPVEFDGRELGDWFALLRPPLKEFNAPGGMMFSIADMPHIARFTQSFKSFRHIARLALRFAFDRLRHPRGTRLTMGNAMAARLLQSAVDAGVTLCKDTPMLELINEGGAIKGVVALREGRPIEIRARRAVVLATGGFSANEVMRREYFPFAEHHVSLVPEGNTGDGLQHAQRAGGRFDGENLSNAGWVVVSVLRQANGKVRKFPHLYLDRGKPGCIAVNQHGRRFGNEAATNLVEPMHRTGSVPAHLICDHRFIKKYGLGLVRPGGWGLQRLIGEGYILTAPTLQALAVRMGVNPDNLQASVTRFNAQALAGVDDDFHRGRDKGDLPLGDPAHRPNPCLGVLGHAPFYAVKIFPGDSTTTVGLRIDQNARVLDADDRPIPGLHAVGLDMNSLWRGRAPGNGANNTLSLTFGYLAAMYLASHDKAASAEPASQSQERESLDGHVR